MASPALQEESVPAESSASSAHDISEASEASSGLALEIYAAAQKVPASLVQGVSVTLAGNLNEEGNFVGIWRYSLEESQGATKPLAFMYRRGRGPPPIPHWQYALARGATTIEVLDLWDPPDAAADDDPAAAAPFLQAPPENSLPPPAWAGAWEGHFVLRKNGRDAEVRERFFLEAAPGTDPRAVTGGGTNPYGRFMLTGTVDGKGLIECNRAYVQLPRKKRRRAGAPTEADSEAARAAQQRRVDKDNEEGGRRRRVPTKFESSDEEERPQHERALFGGGRGGKALSGGGDSATGAVRQRLPTLGTIAVFEQGERGGLYDEEEEDEGESYAMDPSEASGEEEALDGEDGEEWLDAVLDEEVNEVYEGSARGNEREGVGVCVYCNYGNNMYEGEWMANKEHGKGTLMTEKREVIYEGEWSYGLMQGQGTYYFPGGGVYTGDWRENMRHGRGSYTLPSGSRYEGEWVANERHGKGVFEWADGLSAYDGEWVANQRHGRGRLELSTGLAYEGGWAANEPDGRGVMVYPDGQRYEGMFKQGKKEGRGSLLFPNGSSYEGRFRDDGIDGQGTLLIPTPVPGVCEGEWVIPVAFQSDMQRIHAKAGFDKEGL
jgi:hypothetical protein